MRRAYGWMQLVKASSSWRQHSLALRRTERLSVQESRESQPAGFQGSFSGFNIDMEDLIRTFFIVFVSRQMGEFPPSPERAEGLLDILWPCESSIF